MPEEAGRRRDPARGQGRRGAPGDVASSTTRRTPRPPSEELSLLAGMGHELRTVISTLLGYHELLEDGVLGPVPPGAAEAVGRIGDAARELQSMLGGILELVELESGRLDLVHEQVDLPAFVQEISAAHGLRIAAATQDGAAAGGSGFTAWTDRERLRRIVELLVSANRRLAPDSRPGIGVRPDGCRAVRIELEGAAPTLVVAARRGPTSLDRDADATGLPEGVLARIVVAHRIAQGLGGALVGEGAGAGARVGVRLRSGPGAVEATRLPG